MTFKLYGIILGFLITSQISAQNNKNEVLFTVDEDTVLVSEFLRVYNKNLDLVQDESQKDVDEYLTLFTNYKLKLKEARSLNLHEKESYIRELGNYKKQLAKSYISDSKVTDDLVEEAYNRMANEVKANHILVRINEDASPADTIAAYNEIVKLRKRALNEGFEKVRSEVHNGQTVFGEELGYFTGFKMVYKFENVAYNTPVGKISQPFRTRFGYHIINVLDKRQSRGERLVAHIMILHKQTDSISEDPQTRINDIYKRIQQGEEFEALAKQFSDDKASAANGGKLKPFAGGELSVPIFEDVAFGLGNIGDVSQPFESKFGWHIVKLYEKIPVAPFEDMRPELEVKVKRDNRSQLIDEALHAKLRKQYNIASDQPALKYFASILNEDYFKRSWVLPEDFTGDVALLKIGNQQFLYQDFGGFLLKSQLNPQKREPLEDIIAKQYKIFLNESLVQYKEENLEFENEDYAHIVQEYRDGLLLFDLMESTIWNAGAQDSLEVKTFYEKNKDKYVTPRSIDAVVASSSKQKTLKKVAKLLEQGVAIDKIKNLVNSNDNVEVIFTTGIMQKNHQALPEDYKFKKGVSDIYKHNSGYVVINTKDILPETQKSFEDAKGAVISDYQEYKEANWIKELRDKYSITINQKALENVKKSLKVK